MTRLALNPAPTANLGKDTTICTTQVPFTLNGGAFSSYKWSNGATTPSIQVSTSGTYVVTITDDNGCTDTDDVVVTVEICSGTKQPGLKGSYKVYPNPTNGLVNLEMIQFDQGDYRITVFNVQGQLMHTEKINISSDRNITQIDMSSFSKGTYLFKVASDAGVLVRRVIVQE